MSYTQRHPEELPCVSRCGSTRTTAGLAGPPPSLQTHRNLAQGLLSLPLCYSRIPPAGVLSIKKRRSPQDYASFFDNNLLRDRLRDLWYAMAARPPMPRWDVRCMDTRLWLRPVSLAISDVETPKVLMCCCRYWFPFMPAKYHRCDQLVKAILSHK